MDGVAQISEFGKILIFLIVGTLAIGGLFFANRFLSPRNPNPEKLSTYECGEEPTGNAWLPFNSRFYVIALVFLLFDVEMVFVFPWATVFGDKQLIAADSRWGWISLAEMFIFLGILILGLAYVWVKGDLNWIKPKLNIPRTNARIPQNLYEQVNILQGQFAVRDFNAELTPATATASNPAPAPAAEAKRPMFKPTFKKPANDA
ncbi:NADH-quinone oxidoreductase subunit A [Mucilaginibacter conchicola]|uniref:NADH-quinone oxidoreductase subunit A n=1 Tax=Mucilaginibacter conchicola TaxID=2303333 RepID=A0A372NPM0_9SPHI|nr:NADH-quinone oxidoreductase subunit A [Mucilaginibacter conchicola]RFZ90862.1 NADH-quinone oxidoreductase subunit A [Mucilaginibacter conchicola]